MGHAATRYRILWKASLSIDSGTRLGELRDTDHITKPIISNGRPSLDEEVGPTDRPSAPLLTSAICAQSYLHHSRLAPRVLPSSEPLWRADR